ncbi:MAG: deoxycytidylate deaminase [Bacillota bacterium]
MSRPSKDQYYLNIAREVGLRGTCLRRRYGAVIVKDDQIISTGYVGAARGAANCCDIGKCKRQELAIPPGERYELCRSVHAEMNAVIHASRRDMLGSTLYLHGENFPDGSVVENSRPCMLCTRVIINAGIARVVVQESDKKTRTYLVEDWVGEE